MRREYDPDLTVDDSMAMAEPPVAEIAAHSPRPVATGVMPYSKPVAKIAVTDQSSSQITSKEQVMESAGAARSRKATGLDP